MPHTTEPPRVDHDIAPALWPRRTAAFEMLRSHSRAANRKLVDIAAAVVDGHPLLPKGSQAPP